MVRRKKKKLHYKGLIVVISGIESLEVEPITGVLQELSIKVNKGVCPSYEAMVDDVWAIPH